MGLPAPAPRFDHACCALPTAANSQQPDKLVVLGGRDSSQHFTDVHVLDLSSWTWQTGHGVPALGSQVGETASAARGSAGGEASQGACIPELQRCSCLTIAAGPPLSAGLQPPVLLRGQRAFPQGVRRLWQQRHAQVQLCSPGGLGWAAGGAGRAAQLRSAVVGLPGWLG